VGYAKEARKLVYKTVYTAKSAGCGIDSGLLMTRKNVKHLLGSIDVNAASVDPWFGFRITPPASQR